MASLNTAKRDRFERQLKQRWEREQGQKRIIEPAPEPSIATVAAELQAPIDELPEDDPRKISFESIKKAIAKLPAQRLILPDPKQIAEIKNLEGGETMYWLNSKYFTKIIPSNPSLPDKGGWYGVDTAKEDDPPVETKVYIDGQEVATVKRESMFGGKAIEFAEDQAVKPRLNKSLIEKWKEDFKFRTTAGQPTFQFRTFEFDSPQTVSQVKMIAEEQRSVLDAINESMRSAMQEVQFGPFCKANCGEPTKNQSGYCTTCLDRMALVGRTPEPKVKTPLVEMRPKRQIQLED